MENASAHKPVIPADQTPTPGTGLPFIGLRMTGLDATPTGSDAADDVVADFTGSTVTQSPPSGSANLFTVTHSQTVGTVIRAVPGAEGKYLVRFTVVAQTAATVFAGVSLDANAAARNTNPLLTNLTMMGASQRIAAAADTDTNEVTAHVDITQEMVNDPSSLRGAIRMHLSNGADAGAAAAALVLTAASVDIIYLGPLE